MIRLLPLVLLASNCLVMYPSNENVVELTSSDFDKLVLNGDDVWIVEFYMPWCLPCHNLVSEYTEAALALKDSVRLGAIDIEAYQNIGQKYNIRKLPTFKVFGANKNETLDYTGGWVAKEFVEAGLKAAETKIKSKSAEEKMNFTEVIELTDITFDMAVVRSKEAWLVYFFAPWCEPCKNNLPQLEMVARQLKGKVNVGAIDVSVNMYSAMAHEIKNLPTIKLFSSGEKGVSYTGSYQSVEVINWATDKILDNVPPPKVKQIVDEKSFKDACKNSLCVVSILPHILDCQKRCRIAYIDTLTKTGKTFKRMQWGWLWCEAGSQRDLENSLDIGGFGYPTMAAINLKKMKYSILHGAFTVRGIKEFLSKLSFAKYNTALFKGKVLPVISETKPWDGENSAYLDYDKIMDDSDIYMNEKDEL